MPFSQTIILIGPLGAGKSTIGRELARVLKRDFYDTDRVLEERLGVDLSWIFDIEGEISFRKRESDILKELLAQKNCILSTGGGTILLAENRKLIRENGTVIYLHTELKQQLKRTYYNKHNRPSLRVDNVEECLKKMNRNRDPLYREIAHAHFSTNHQSFKQVLALILDFLKTPQE